ncbi:NTP transferase domain-containing protein [Gracilinema caldarium]|uniref:nucleotidyltransferase family protein n=1 Tax=Gracilinema caldarium TaxID=215591 RepID=UPI0026F2345A|nr:NTP transferase domain-containing protein [Gracilinema caldarium]
MMKGPILLVLAAGMGSRFGGLKQLEGLGIHGETLLEYSVYDAIRAGFSTAVFVIRKDMEALFREKVLSRFSSHLECLTVFQEPNFMIDPTLVSPEEVHARTKPWGTAHAVLCVSNIIDRPFAVINADDFYGREAFNAMGAFLSAEDQQNKRDAAMIVYPLDQTLSPEGPVARGICTIQNGILKEIIEHINIEKIDERILSRQSQSAEIELAPSSGVSMNFWGLKPTIFPDLADYFIHFLKTKGREPKSECYLPMAIDYLIQHRGLIVNALTTGAQWFGVTYREDRIQAEARLNTMIAQGMYPEYLWK